MGVKEDRATAKELLPDALWLRIAPLIPPEAPKRKGERPRASDRAARTGIPLGELFHRRNSVSNDPLPE